MVLRSLPLRPINLVMSKKGVKTPSENNQKTISSFFQKSEKRAPLSNTNKECEPPSKVLKPSNTLNSSLSPEQKKKMADNKALAQQKLQERTTKESGMGQSWKEALKDEFTKPYYLKVKGDFKVILVIDRCFVVNVLVCFL